MTILSSLSGSWDKSDKKVTCLSPLGLILLWSASADRANVVYRDLHGCHEGYFEVLFVFVVGLDTLSRKVCAFGLQKNILTLSFHWYVSTTLMEWKIV